MALTVTGIRTDAVARLKGKTAAGQNVRDSLAISVDGPDQMPLLNVFIPDTREEHNTATSTRFKATTTLRIDGYVAGDSEASLAAAIDAFEVQTRRALLADAAWLKQFERIGEVSARRGLNAEGDRLFGQFSLTVELVYRTSYPPVAEDPFTELGVTVDTIGPTDDGPAPDGSPEATMEIQLQGADVPEDGDDD
jgi:hypothetical protein